MRLRRLVFVLPFLAIAFLTVVVATSAQTGLKLAGYYSLMPPKVIDPDYAPAWIDGPRFTADLNGDDNEDLVVLGVDYACCGNTAIVPQPGRVFFGDGDGNFTAPAPGVFPVDSFKMVDPRKVVFGDLNGDGRLDMFIACHGWDTDPYPGEQNRLYLSQPGGGWQDATATLPQLDDYTHSAAFGDLSGRGVLDIIVGNYFGGQNHISSYALLNDGAGRFTMTRANIPAGPGEAMDAQSGHWFLGTTLADLDGDGLPELILAASGTNPAPYSKLTHTTILWNERGAFNDSNKTELPYPSPFGTTHIDLDTQPIDFNGDGLPDLVIVGSQVSPQVFYDGWFVQLLQNQGNSRFVDVTASRLAPSDTFGGTPDIATGSPWPLWVKVLDYNEDGFPDFSVEYWPPDAGSHRGLLPSQPLIYLNDGTGHFSTLKVGDFVTHGNEWVLGGGHLVRTRNGYSFITPYMQPGKSGLLLTGLLATKPYRQSGVSRPGVIPPRPRGNPRRVTLRVTP
jgi:VCBS repeat protein